jgi:beta-N-acetylhexosaminidase
LILFALCAPYYLDATNISKLTAYFTLYSKSPAFIDSAAYLLFRELQPAGASPVSILGVSYDLNQMLFPSPEQTIPLELDFPAPEASAPEITPSPTPVPEFRLGDVIPLRAGVIIDHNGNPVPDGTLVDFVFSAAGGASITRQSSTTTGGTARTTYSVASPGTLEITVFSEAARSDVMRFEIASPGDEPPTLTPTQTPSPEPTATATITPRPLPPPAPTPVSAAPLTPGFADWMIAILVSGLVGWGCYQLAAFAGHVRWGVRLGFLAAIGGLLAYCYLVAGLPGSQDLLEGSISRAVLLSTATGSLVGLVAALIWRALTIAGQKRSAGEEQSK